jgi:UDP-N-acetylmuramoylalanine--D-glutamate ligase
MKPAELENLDIAILGVGREGQAAHEYLRKLFPGMRLTLITESDPDRVFAAQLSPLDQLVTGPLADAGLEQFDLLLRSPGISPYRKSLRRAVSAGVIVTSPSNLWFSAHPEARTICVTGTKGKSTTSALLAHVIKACGQQVRLAGNIGRPLLACSDEDVDWWVIELSSYQLTDLRARPTVAVILNLSAEHLDWHGSEKAYRADKLRLAELAADAPLIANAADATLRGLLAGHPGIHWFNDPAGLHVADSGLWDGNMPLDLQMPTGLPGRHSLDNAAAALAVLDRIGIEPQRAAREIGGFRSLPHRLQIVGQRHGVSFVNDSISSTPVATVAALEAFAGRSVILLVGGLDRGLDWTPYSPGIAQRLPEAIIAIPDNGPLILKTLREAGISPPKGLHVTDNLRQAVALAGKLAVDQAAVVLLSPGAPSFPQFEDYRDRGRQFARLSGFQSEEWDPW